MTRDACARATRSGDGRFACEPAELRALGSGKRLAGTLPIEEFFEAMRQPCRQAFHHLTLLGFGTLDVAVFGQLRCCSERVKEKLHRPPRDQQPAADAAPDEAPLRYPVLDCLRADTDESGCLTSGHVPTESRARIW